MPDTPDILDVMEAVCEAATKPPWVEEPIDGDPDILLVRDYGPRYAVAKACGWGHERAADATFMSQARTGWPRAIKALRVARATLEFVRDQQQFGVSGAASAAITKVDAILEGRDG